MKKINITIKIILSLFLLILVPSLCSARSFEVPFLDLPTNPSIYDYAALIFNYAMGLVGVLTVLAFILGAVQYMTSAGSPERSSEGASRMKSAILGLVISLSSIVIINQINPLLIDKNMLPPKVVSLTDVVLIKAGAVNGEKLPCPNFITDSDTLEDGFRTILVDCEPSDKSPTYFLFSYTSPNLGGNLTVQTLSCGQSAQVTKSFRVEEKLPGIYLIKDNCSTGYRERFTGNVPAISLFFQKTVKCVEIVNDPRNGIYYGAILHASPDYIGSSTDPMAANDKGRTYYIAGSESLIRNGPFGSLTVFRYDPSWKPSIGMEKVTFYAYPQYDSSGGYFEMNNDTMKKFRTSSFRPGEYSIPCQDMLFSYTPGTPDNVKDACIYSETGTRNFCACYGSIKIEGNYLVAVSARKIETRNGSKDISEWGCYPFSIDESFGVSSSNLLTTWIGEKKKELTWIYIYRLK